MRLLDCPYHAGQRIEIGFGKQGIAKLTPDLLDHHARLASEVSVPKITARTRAVVHSSLEMTVWLARLERSYWRITLAFRNRPSPSTRPLPNVRLHCNLVQPGLAHSLR